jgi:hypothetical protein
VGYSEKAVCDAQANEKTLVHLLHRHPVNMIIFIGQPDVDVNVWLEW